jgi:hypothetical protein
MLQTYTSIFRENNEGMIALLLISEQLLNVVSQIAGGSETNTLFNLLLNPPTGIISHGRLGQEMRLCQHI